MYHLHYFSERALLVGSSPIHGCGLFTLVDLVEGQMIIEYTGEVVRPCLTDKRERENEGKVRINEKKISSSNECVGFWLLYVYGGFNECD